MHQVVRRVFALQVLHVGGALLGKSPLFQVLLGLLKSAVIRVVVEEDDMVILVVLIENRQHGLFVAIILNIIVAEHDNTKWHLPIFVCRNVIQLVILHLLSFC